MRRVVLCMFLTSVATASCSLPPEDFASYPQRGADAAAEALSAARAAELIALVASDDEVGSYVRTGIDEAYDEAAAAVEAFAAVVPPDGKARDFRDVLATKPTKTSVMAKKKDPAVKNHRWPASAAESLPPGNSDSGCADARRCAPGGGPHPSACGADLETMTANVYDRFDHLDLRLVVLALGAVSPMEIHYIVRGPDDTLFGSLLDACISSRGTPRLLSGWHRDLHIQV